MRVLFCGGGTAGHVNPAIAVAQTVMRNSKENKIAYVTTINGIENKLVDFKKYKIDVMGLQRKLSVKNMAFFYKQLVAIKKCKQIIKEFHPDVVFGTGGYATYPVAVAAHKLGIKVVLHESNAIPGKAILSLQKRAEKILINFDESKEYFKFKDKVVHTGNPIRNSFETQSKSEVKRNLKIDKKYVILCMGGSLGAHRINNSAIEIIDNLIRHRNDICFIWSTGKKEYETAIESLNKRGLSGIEGVIISDYFNNVPQLMNAADIVISRAGAMTISELAYTKKAAILVPSPNVTNNHQYVNANALEKAGAAIMVTEDKLYTMVDVLKGLLKDEGKRSRLENEIGEYSIRNANKKIYDILCDII